MDPISTETKNIEYAPLKPNEIRLIRMTGSDEDTTANWFNIIMKLMKPRPINQTTGELEPESEPQLPPEAVLSIEHFELGHCPPFLALSYVWGDPNDTANITVDGRALQVPTNLVDALVQIFEVSRTLQSGIATNLGMSEDSLDEDKLFLWVDSICINQADVAERSRQVPRMNDIYSSAYSVIVWLGDFEKLQRYTGLNPLSIHSLLVNLMDMEAPDGFPKHVGEWAFKTPEGPFEDRIASYCKLMCTPWFRRVWVLQEYALSHRQPCALTGIYLTPISALYELPSKIQEEIRCGTLELSPEEVTSLPDNIRLMEDIRDATWNSTALRRQIHDPGFQGKSLAQKLLAMVTKMGGKGASVQHDYIYGLLGMVDLADLPPYLTPDYTLPHASVFADYARFLIGETHNLQLLMDRTEYPERLDGVPSWVPHPGTFSPQLAYEPEPQTQHIGAFSADGRVLTAQGTQVSFLIQLFRHDFKDEDGELVGPEQMLERFYSTSLTISAFMREKELGEVVREWIEDIHRLPLSTPPGKIDAFFERYPTLEDYILAVCTGPLFEEDEDGEEVSEEVRFDRRVLSRFGFFYYAIDTIGRVSIIHCCREETLVSDQLMTVWALKGSTKLSVLQETGTDGEYRYVGWLDMDVKLDEEFFSSAEITDVHLI